MKRFIAIFILLVATQAAVSQETRALQFNLEWMEGASLAELPVGQLGFEGAQWLDDLPVFFYEEALNFRANRADARWSNINSESVPASLLTSRQLNQLPDAPEIDVRVAQAPGKSYLQVQLLPIWKDPQTGSIRRLTSFSGDVQIFQGKSSASRALNWAETSVLSEGEWYKMAITNDGVYRIDRSFLQSLGIDVNNINPQQINIYGNGGELLPIENSVDRPDDLIKNAIYVEGENDGSFDQNDYILFYGKGPDSWIFNEGGAYFSHEKHFYSDSAYYFIRIDDQAPERVQNLSDPGSPNTSSTSFLDRQFVENEITNVAKSGREYYGERFASSQTIPYVFNMPGLLAEEVRVDAQVAARSIGAQSSFLFTAAGNSMTVTPNSTTTNVTANIVNLSAGTLVTTPASGNTFQVNVQFNPATADAEGWLDYLRVNARRQLSMSGSQLAFRDPQSIGAGNVTEFIVANGSSVREIWDITNFTNPRRVSFEATGGPQGELAFRSPTDELKEFIAFADFNYLTPNAIGRVENQNLHAFGNIDMVILSAPAFLSVAEDFKALHEQEGLSIEVVTPMQVYNEFSSGSGDVTAIKSLMKMLYDRAGSDESLRPKYLQIIGDGSFVNRHILPNAPQVITYQSLNSRSPVNSYVSDDYFGFLDDQYGEGLGDKLAIGVGRIPCETLSEARGYYEKVKNYISSNTTSNGDAWCLGDANQSPYGSWRNVITLVADDMDGSGGPSEIFHMANSDEHADRVFDDYNDYDVVKIYMDAYQQESTPGGERYPAVEDAIRRRVENGSLIVNYIGHGGERGFAHERVLNIQTIQGWTNFNRLPLFVTATCELARFDDPEFKSAGELIVLNQNGGAIAMLTTTRIVFSGSNQQLNRAFFDVALEDANIENLSLGMITMTTKNDNQVSDVSNKRNFSLLGDVALKLSYPKVEVYTTEMNGVEVDPIQPDTARSLQLVTFKGFVGDGAGNKLTDFNGFVYPTVYDKKSQITTLNNDGALNPYEFEMWRNILYKGKASVTNGDFSFSFVVPRDISFDFGDGRISYYAVAGDLDGHGHFEDFVIGGALEGAELSDVAPELSLFMNDSTFVFGGITNENPILLGVVRAENGVNTVGSGIGHDLKAILDGNTADPIILNDYYEADLDTYQSGTVRYQLRELSEGVHNISLKVWDVHNNSTESYTEFVVAGSAEVALEHVLNYPNPFTTRTQFMFEHNQACEFLDVQIQVFTVSGKMVKSINRLVRSEGFRSEPIEWDGLDDFGDVIAKGVYVYRVKVSTPEGQTAERFEKLVILR